MSGRGTDGVAISRARRSRLVVLVLFALGVSAIGSGPAGSRSASDLTHRIPPGPTPRDPAPRPNSAQPGSSTSAAPSSSSNWIEYTVAGGVVTVAAVLIGLAYFRRRTEARPIPWIPGSPVGASEPSKAAVPGKDIPVVLSPEMRSAAKPPTLRQRWARHPPDIGLVVGMALLAGYLIAGLTALFEFQGSLNVLPRNPAWVPSIAPIGPSWTHPFGVMPGFGTDLFRAIWRATPWDLAIVASILALDGLLGFFLGGMAGAREGGVFDGVVTFMSDSLGSIPSFILVIIAFAGLAFVLPQNLGLPVFVAVFGFILWPTMARTVRERARSVSHQPFVEAARASGATPSHLLVRHILPNSLGPMLAQLPLDVAPIFFVLSAFPWYYNCAGPSPVLTSVYALPALPALSPLPSAVFPEWGYLLGVGTCFGAGFPGQVSYWWMYAFPLMAILVFGLAIGLVCDGIDRWRALGGSSQG
jgi:peptide/nickel transport system permease protein